MRAAVLCLALCAAGAGPAQADGTPDTARLAVDRCLRQLRACQLPDGAFAQVSPQGRPGAPVWIVPYFSHFAALALLAHVEAGGAADDRTRAGRWFDWCAAQTIAAKRPEWKNAKHADQWESTIKAYASPAFGRLPAQFLVRRVVGSRLVARGFVAIVRQPLVRRRCLSRS